VNMADAEFTPQIVEELRTLAVEADQLGMIVAQFGLRTLSTAELVMADLFKTSPSDALEGEPSAVEGLKRSVAQRLRARYLQILEAAKATAEPYSPDRGTVGDYLSYFADHMVHAVKSFPVMEHLGDPAAQELARLEAENQALRAELAARKDAEGALTVHQRIVQYLSARSLLFRCKERWVQQEVSTGRREPSTLALEEPSVLRAIASLYKLDATFVSEFRPDRPHPAEGIAQQEVTRFTSGREGVFPIAEMRSPELQNAVALANHNAEVARKAKAREGFARRELAFQNELYDEEPQARIPMDSVAEYAPWVLFQLTIQPALPALPALAREPAEPEAAWKARRRLQMREEGFKALASLTDEVMALGASVVPNQGGWMVHADATRDVTLALFRSYGEERVKVWSYVDYGEESGLDPLDSSRAVV